MDLALQDEGGGAWKVFPGAEETAHIWAPHEVSNQGQERDNCPCQKDKE